MSEDIQINLSEQIRAAYAEANAIAEKAKSYASEAVAKAIECGRLLLQQKQALGHGSWMEWTAKNIPEIHHNTLGRYMRVAKSAQEALPSSDTSGDSNSSPVMNLNDAPTLKQAYIALGILPPPASKSDEQPDPNKPWVKFTRFLDGFRLWFNKRIDEDPLATWPEDSRRVLKNELKWFAELYQRL
jgi:hypothetical protein